MRLRRTPLRPTFARARPPTLAEAQEWAEHFGAARRPNQLVLIADPQMIGPASYAMVPGLQLVDGDFVLRFDSTGHNPHHNLWNDLLAGLPALLDAITQYRGGADSGRG